MKTLDDNCTECTKEGKIKLNEFDTVGKTYYKMYQYKNEPLTILCYRHWHQQNQPPYQLEGDYHSIFKN